MNYKIIIDKDAMLEFIDGLPDLTVDEKYYFCLFGRKKYCKDIKYIKSDKTQLSRHVARKERIFTKIQQMECELDAYTQGDTSIPQEAIALYINPNPRCLRKAALEGLKKLADVIALNAIGFDPQAELMSCIQRSISRKVWSDFDIDTKEEGTLEKVQDILQDKNCYRILESRGGYHILVELSKIPEGIKKVWYKQLASLADIQGDCMLPVPGSYCGGFTPKFIDIF